MIRGIAIIGLNGAGKSTLNHALANQIDYLEMDLEDYYFPDQRESRKGALENNIQNYIENIGELPFANPRSKHEVQQSLIEDISAHSKFIISGVTLNWSDEIISRIDIAFWVKTPLDLRLKRIQTREEKRFGGRVLDGGDMFSQQLDFQNLVKKRDIKTVEECAKKLNCPIIEIDGTLSVKHNLEKIMDHLRLYNCE
ncbi:P-loop NTPase family protein [Fusibacter ferrireducens]|uniref:AAA family ATPase n=1 Tax=Fusibacter ferrireducens TaxID=2785058 RepID=A0ABR9ZNM2_9FIRM|nr:AAA family ATPase [Fusibacter ferrireducens]MBF4692065.1 AAA family ATPase [Fusibacter ferrireducens]